MNYYPKPTKEHIEWAECELGVIIHFCLETFKPIPIEGIKCSKHILTPDLFNPTKLNTDQWIQSAKTMGAKYAVLVANHCTGFSLWPTQVNGYSVESGQYKAGKVDVVAEFIQSCKKFDIKPGIYYSTGCNGFYDINDYTADSKAEDYKEYIQIVEAQVKELWTQYGELFEIWFDGGLILPEEGGPNVYPILQQYQPQAICFQGPHQHDKNIRWVGNEDGNAPLDCWSTAGDNTCSFNGDTVNEEVGKGLAQGAYWIPAETDMPNRSHKAYGGGWGWKAGEEQYVLSPDYLLQCYYQSVGRNTNLLLGMAITDEGLFPDEEQFKELGDKIRGIYEQPIQSVSGEGSLLEIELEAFTPIRHIEIKEEIAKGERVRQYTIWAETEKGREMLLSAGCIGHKRLIPVENLKVKKVSLEITQSIDRPMIQSFTLYA